MKKLIIGSLVGAILLFGWQSLSWTMLGIHDKAFRYTPAQDSLLNTISSTLTTEGQYMLPTVPPKSSHQAMEELGKKMEGKPWAIVSYHKTYETDMVKQMLKGFLTIYICIFLCCIIIGGSSNKTFFNGFFTALSFGIVSFLFVWYIGHIWMGTNGYVLKAELIDSLVGWGLVGLWLGWWYNRK